MSHTEPHHHHHHEHVDVESELLLEEMGYQPQLQRGLVDMEGVTGVTDPEDVLPDGADYARGRVFMTGDANAAILGAHDAGTTEVLVNDSRWTMRNLLLDGEPIGETRRNVLVAGEL